MGGADDVCVRAGNIPAGRGRGVLVDGLERGSRGLVAGCVWGRNGCLGGRFAFGGGGSGPPHPCGAELPAYRARRRFVGAVRRGCV